MIVIRATSSTLVVVTETASPFTANSVFVAPGQVSEFEMHPGTRIKINAEGRQTPDLTFEVEPIDNSIKVQVEVIKPLDQRLRVLQWALEGDPTVVEPGLAGDGSEENPLRPRVYSGFVNHERQVVLDYAG
jgi:hypothetical protein